MEDRLTPVLYLEMTEADPDDYARSRVGDVLALPGVERATWWRNVYRDRPDLPRELAEFDTLGVYECDPSFVAPATPDGIAGHHFLRTPRPGQGRLTGKPTVSLSLVLISPTTEDEAQALRDWGDFVHLNYIVEAGIPGFTMITPVRERHQGRPALPALLRVRRPRRRGHVQADAPAGGGEGRRVGHAGVRGVGGPSRAAHHVRQLVRARRRQSALAHRHEHVGAVARRQWHGLFELEPGAGTDRGEVVGRTFPSAGRQRKHQQVGLHRHVVEGTARTVGVDHDDPRAFVRGLARGSAGVPRPRHPSRAGR